MAGDTFMVFTPYGADKPIDSESQVKFDTKVTDQMDPLGTKFNKFGPTEDKPGQVFEIDTYSFDIEQTINMSSQSSGAGAGKVTFNPFKITRKIDIASPKLFEMCCKDTTFKNVSLGIRKAAGVTASGLFFLRFDFKLVAVKGITWNHGDDSPTEDVEFEYGGLIVNYCQQKSDGSLMTAVPGGWNKIRNVHDTSVDTPI